MSDDETMHRCVLWLKEIKGHGSVHKVIFMTPVTSTFIDGYMKWLNSEVRDAGDVNLETEDYIIYKAECVAEMRKFHLLAKYFNTNIMKMIILHF